MPRPLEGAVVVITGASSGIGRAAALRFARRDSSLALCARSQPELDQVARECEAAGTGAVLAQALDVADETAVEALAAATEERFGRIDVWVNNAGTMAYGRFEEIPSEVFRSVIETNLMGQVHGARAALRRFKAQGSGVLINLSSVWGRVISPQVSPYIVSKNAVRALSECIAAELAAEDDIHVATIAPQAVDTPIFRHAANYSGHQTRPIPPIVSPDEVAAGIVRCAESPQRELKFGQLGRLLEASYTFLPAFYRRFGGGAFMRGTMDEAPAAATAGNVLESGGAHQVDGEWRRHRRGTLRQAFLAAAAGSVAGLVGATAWALKEND